MLTSSIEARTRRATVREIELPAHFGALIDAQTIMADGPQLSLQTAHYADRLSGTSLLDAG
jgi:hypothetical protein